MYRTKSHRCDDRIVSIHQPHVRPIIRGKLNKSVEFGAKISVSLTPQGIAKVDHLRWDAFNEGGDLETQVEAYQRRYGFIQKPSWPIQSTAPRKIERISKTRASATPVKPWVVLKRKLNKTENNLNGISNSAKLTIDNVFQLKVSLVKVSVLMGSTRSKLKQLVPLKHG